MSFKRKESGTLKHASISSELVLSSTSPGITPTKGVTLTLNLLTMVSRDPKIFTQFCGRPISSSDSLKAVIIKEVSDSSCIPPGKETSP